MWPGRIGKTRADSGLSQETAEGVWRALVEAQLRQGLPESSDLGIGGGVCRGAAGAGWTA